MERTYVCWWYRVLLSGGFSFFALCLGIGLGQYSVWLGLALGLPPAVVAVRSARAGVTLTPRGVEVRGVWHTRRSPWSEIKDVRVTAGSSTGLLWRIPEFVLNDGEIRAEDLRSLRSGGRVDEVVAAAKGFLDSSMPDGPYSP